MEVKPLPYWGNGCLLARAEKSEAKSSGKCFSGWPHRSHGLVGAKATLQALSRTWQTVCLPLGIGFEGTKVSWGTAEVWYHVAGSGSLKRGQEAMGEGAVSVTVGTSDYRGHECEVCAEDGSSCRKERLQPAGQAVCAADGRPQILNPKMQALRSVLDVGLCLILDFQDRVSL